MFRWLADIAALVVILALGSGFLFLERGKRDRDATLQRVAADARRFELELKYRAATQTVEINARGWPVTVDPAWFEPDPPVNVLLSPHRPWVEIAAPDEAGFLHPRVRMAVDESFAAFWYNPYQGVVRARVPVMVNDDQATDIYNSVNGTNIASIFFEEKPRPQSDGPAGGRAYIDPEATATGQPAFEPEVTSEPPPSTAPARVTSPAAARRGGAK